MRRVCALVAFAMALAGCAQPASPPAVEEPPVELEAASFRQAIDKAVHLNSRSGCTVAVCATGSDPTPLFRAPANASITGLRLDVAQDLLRDRPVDWRLVCKGDHHGCQRLLARGHDPLPLEIRLEGLRLPPGSVLEIELQVDPVTPAIDYWTEQVWMRLTGEIELQESEGAGQVGTLVLPVSADLHSGPCSFVEPSCMLRLEANGTAVGADLVMTWTTTSDLDRELGLHLASASYCEACIDAQAAGPSPLRLSTLGAFLSPEVLLQVVHPDGTTAQPGAAGTRTPVHVEGVLFVQPEPPLDLPAAPLNVSLDGHSGPCAFVEPDCYTYPGGSDFMYPDLNGTVVGSDLDMTWTPTGDLDRELGLRLTYYSCGSTCPPDAEAVGPSPLALKADRLQFSHGVVIEVFHPGAAPLFGDSFAGTRTPVHIEGHLVVLAERPGSVRA